MSDDDIIASDKPQEPNPIRLVATLAVAGLISGIAIVGIYEATFATIAENRARELREAVFTVLPGIERMQEYVYRDGALSPGPKVEDEEQSVYAGYDARGEFQGYAIRGEGPGFQDTIVLLYGYHPYEREIVGMQVLESRETPGLGDKIYKDQDFVDEFAGLAVDPVIELIKGTGSKSNQVDAITGATISSRAVVRIINESNAAWLDKLPDSPPAYSSIETADVDASVNEDGKD